MASPAGRGHRYALFWTVSDELLWRPSSDNGGAFPSLSVFFPAREKGHFWAARDRSLSSRRANLATRPAADFFFSLTQRREAPVTEGVGAVSRSRSFSRADLVDPRASARRARAPHDAARDRGRARYLSALSPPREITRRTVRPPRAIFFQRGRVFPSSAQKARARSRRRARHETPRPAKKNARRRAPKKRHTPGRPLTTTTAGPGQRPPQRRRQRAVRRTIKDRERAARRREHRRVGRRGWASKRCGGSPRRRRAPTGHNQKAPVPQNARRARPRRDRRPVPTRHKVLEH